MIRKVWFSLAVSAAIAFVAISSSVYATSSISSLPDGGSSITSSSVLPMDSTLNGSTVRATIGQLLGIGASLYQPLGTYLTDLTVTEPIEKTGTTAPSITCRVATDSVSGCLSASDHTAYSALVAGGGGITAITATAPLSRTTGATPVISMTQSATGVDGWLGAADRATLFAKQPPLGFTAENTANKGAAYGYAALDSGGKVPYANLSGTPSITTTSPLTNTAFAISMPAATDSVPGHLTAADHLKITNAVPNTAKVNGHDFTGGDIAITAADIGLATISGRLLSITYLTSSGTYTPPAGAATIRLKMQGAGGGGGGAKTGAGYFKTGSGANSGSYGEKLLSISPSTGYSYVVGAAGTGGANTGADGIAGGYTSFVVGTTSYVVAGGSPGDGDADVALGYNIVPAQQTYADCTLMDFCSPGKTGGYGIRLNFTKGAAGKGADSFLGTGGYGFSSGYPGPYPGDDGRGYGAGGGGGSNVTGGAAGGAGSPGLIIVEAYSGS